MNDKNINLEHEAQFQDSKVESNVRKNLSKYYMDEASNLCASCRDDLLGDLRDKTVLDLGCGKGEATIAALKAGAYVTSVDISPKSIELVKKIASDIGLANNLNAMVMDAQNLQISDHSFDIVFGNGILHHLPDFKKSLKEIRRVLKPTGYAVFNEPLGMNPFLNLFRAVTPKMRTKDEQPLRIKELNMVKEVFPDSQFIFFDFATLIAKFFLLVRLNKFAHKMQKSLISLDDKLLRSKSSNKVTFFQKMSWYVVMKMPK